VKLILSVDVQETSEGFTFTLHHNKKATTWKVKVLGAGFKKIEAIVKKIQEENK
jgi:hypothetical protein